MRGALISFMAIAFCAGQPSSATAQTSEQLRQKSAFEALQILFLNQDLKLGDNPSCRGLVDGVADPTLGDWMSWVFSHLNVTEGATGVVAGCSGPADRLQCEVKAQRRAGEEVWSWGVSFEANGATQKLVPATLICHASG